MIDIHVLYFGEQYWKPGDWRDQTTWISIESIVGGESTLGMNMVFADPVLNVFFLISAFEIKRILEDF